MSSGEKINASNAERPSKKETQPPKKWFRWPTYRCLEIIFTGTVALFTIVLAGVSYKQWQAMERQSEAMIMSNRLLRESNEYANRAWLTVKHVRDAPPIVAGSRAPLTAEIENTGRSPAQNIRVHAATAYVPLDWPIPERAPESEITSGVIGPGQTRSVDFGLKQSLSQADVDAINNGTRRIYWFADITYTYQFSPDRLLQFCFYYMLHAKNVSIVSYPVCNIHESVK